MALLISAAAACGNPAKPTPVTEPPRIACPSPQTATSPDGNAVGVIYPPPTVSGGAPPVTTTCTHQSGWAFNVGVTRVACTALDAQNRADSCGFTVTVAAGPRIAATRYLAFGDSITYGSAALCNRSFAADPRRRYLDDLFSLRANVVAGSYPTVLQGLLENRYVNQSPIVVNEGAPGEPVTSSSAFARLIGKLAEHSPDALLLQEGVNDLHGGVSSAEVVAALRSMIREARSRNVQVFLGTLIPEVQHPGWCRAYHPELIAPTNALIRPMAASEGAVLVDLYAAFGGEGSSLIGADGLHPSEAGYRAIAEAFFQAIRERLEEIEN